MRPLACATLALSLSLTACGDNAAPTVDDDAPDAGAEPRCDYPEYDHGTDGLYEGYVECSPARFPDFKHPTTRWDGSYAEGCVGTTGLDAFACSEQLFWEVLQFDTGGRAAAYEALDALNTLEGANPVLLPTQRARMSWRLGMLATAMASEDGDYSAAAAMQGHIEDAVEILPDNVLLQAWLKTVQIMIAVQLGGDEDAVLAELWALYERDPAAIAGAVLGVAVGLSDESGWPATAVDIVEGIDLDDCGVWCEWEFLRAPYARTGQYFLYAETYARVGDLENTALWLDRVAELPGTDTWPFADELAAARADVAAFSAKFTDRGDDEEVFDLMLMNTAGTCQGCHAYER
jgi:hypothetical protein